VGRLIGAAECGTHGIHEDQVGLRQQGVGIVDPGIRGRSNAAVIHPLCDLPTPDRGPSDIGCPGGAGELEYHRRRTRSVILEKSRFYPQINAEERRLIEEHDLLFCI